MATRNKRLMLSAAVVLMFALATTSCLKDGDDTIVLPLPNGKIPYSVISEDMQDSLQRHGFLINEGIEPPIINGHYLSSPMVQDYSSDGNSLAFVDVDMTFARQLEIGLIKYIEKQLTPNGGEMDSRYYEANIIGSGDKFTVYSWQYNYGTNTDSTNWTVKTATLISGKFTSAGIADCQYAIVVLEKVNDIYNRIPAVDTYRIWHDGDSLAVTL